MHITLTGNELKLRMEVTRSKSFSVCNRALQLASKRFRAECSWRKNASTTDVAAPEQTGTMIAGH